MMEYITRNKDIGKLTRGTIGVYAGSLNEESYSFTQVREYYLWTQHGMDKKGFGSRWAKGAAYLVDELADTFQSTDRAAFSTSSGGIFPSLGQLMKELNIGIAKYAIGIFKDFLYDSAGEAVTNWYEWDKKFIWAEQVTIAAPATYKKYEGTFALTMMNAIARKSLPIPSKHFFPDFSKFYINLTNKNDN